MHMSSLFWSIDRKAIATEQQPIYLSLLDDGLTTPSIAKCVGPSGL